MNKDITLRELRAANPFIMTYLDDMDMVFNMELSFRDNIYTFPESFFEQRKTSAEKEIEEFEAYLSDVNGILGTEFEAVKEITVYPGHYKDGTKEDFVPIKIKSGEMVAVVGETGSGKSRLLEDIEWQTDGDTPTGRKVYFDNARRAEREFINDRQRLVAQLSQNMNFVIDMSVEEFITMHAGCFSLNEEIGMVVDRVYLTACELSGENFEKTTAVTSLSGGQSRALMIADCAILSKASVVLIDEIENAGIDRKKAMELLTGSDKIVLIATHDPVLALMSDRRIVIKNGGISDIIEKNEVEEKALMEAEKMDRALSEMRNKLRRGERLE